MLRERRRLNFSTLVLIPLSILLFFSHSVMGSVVKEKDKREILNKVYTLKIPFIENKGQIKDESVRYYAKELQNLNWKFETLGRGQACRTMGSNANIYLPSSNYGKTSCNLKTQKNPVISGQSYTVMGKLEITGFSSGWKGWIHVYDKDITGSVAWVNISSDNNTFSLALEEGEYYFLFGLEGDVENEEVLLSYVLDGETLTLKPVPDVDFDSLTPLVVNRNIDLGKLICDISGDIIHVSFTVKMPLDIDGYFWICEVYPIF